MIIWRAQNPIEHLMGDGLNFELVVVHPIRPNKEFVRIVRVYESVFNADGWPLGSIFEQRMYLAKTKQELINRLKPLRI